MLLIFSSAVFAVNETTQNNTNTELCEYIIEKAEIPVGTKMPGALPYKNEVMNIYTENETPVGHLSIEKGIVKEYECVLTNNATNKVYLKNKKTIDDIIDSENQVDALLEKIDSDEIIITGATAGKKIKNFFAITTLRVVSLFT